MIDDWKPGVHYLIGQTVKNGDKYYCCEKEHTSQEEFDKFRFVKIKVTKEDNIERDPEFTNGTRFVIITSMDKKYYEASGKAMMQSYKRHGRSIGPLYVYNEQLFEPKVKNVNKAGWMLGSEFVKFQRRHSNNKIKTFSKKAFPIIDAMDRFVEFDRIVWLDADAVFTADFPRLLIELLAPDDVLSSHFSVYHNKDGREYHSCETGFFVLNRRHEGFKEFCDLYKDIYYNDLDEYYNLRRFYDGEVYGKCVELMEKKGYKMFNMNTGKHKTPVSRSLVAPYISHFKAGLKNNIDFTKYLDEEDEV
jgi:hypothetical protein